MAYLFTTLIVLTTRSKLLVVHGVFVCVCVCVCVGASRCAGGRLGQLHVSGWRTSQHRHRNCHSLGPGQWSVTHHWHFTLHYVYTHRIASHTCSYQHQGFI